MATPKTRGQANLVGSALQKLGAKQNAEILSRTEADPSLVKPAEPKKPRGWLKRFDAALQKVRDAKNAASLTDDEVTTLLEGASDELLHHERLARLTESYVPRAVRHAAMVNPALRERTILARLFYSDRAIWGNPSLPFLMLSHPEENYDEFAKSAIFEFAESTPPDETEIPVIEAHLVPYLQAWWSRDTTLVHDLMHYALRMGLLRARNNQEEHARVVTMLVGLLDDALVGNDPHVLQLRKNLDVLRKDFRGEGSIDDLFRGLPSIRDFHLSTLNRDVQVATLVLMEALRHYYDQHKLVVLHNAAIVGLRERGTTKRPQLRETMLRHIQWAYPTVPLPLGLREASPTAGPTP